MYLLNVAGEALSLILALRRGLVPSSHLSNGLLEELGKFQLRGQALLLLLLLHKVEILFADFSF